jgi:uncharacterized protein YnzC (UPF0291/DUF896 family)
MENNIFCNKCNKYHLRNEDNYYFNSLGHIVSCKIKLKRKEMDKDVLELIREKERINYLLKGKKRYGRTLKSKTKESELRKEYSKTLPYNYVARLLSIKFKIPIIEIKEDYSYMIDIYRLHLKMKRACNAPKNLITI